MLLDAWDAKGTLEARQQKPKQFPDSGFPQNDRTAFQAY
jgi:hypothetical protein